MKFLTENVWTFCQNISVDRKNIREFRLRCNSMVGTDDYSETEKCCGSGCNNCVLDKKTAFSKRLSVSHLKSNILTNDEHKYVKVNLSNKSKCTENAWLFQFTYCNINNLDCSSMELSVPPGHHIMIRAPVNESDNPRNDRHDPTTEGNFISRPYTPINVDKSGMKFDILVKFEPNGLMSEYLRNCSIGDVIEVKGPYGSFEWKPNKVRNLICISQGVAISPMYAIVQEILQNDEDETWIDFLSCHRHIKDILLRDEIYDLQQYWNFQSSFYLSNETKSCCNNVKSKNCPCIKSQLKYNEVVCAFRLDEIELSKMFIKKPIENCLTLICGRSQFVNSIKRSLEKLHVKGENIFVFD